MGTHSVLLPVGADLYALPVDWVQEVVAAPPVTRLATAPALVIGLFNLRGEIIPLLDTAALLGVGRVESVAFAAVLTSPQGPAGLAATAFPQRVTLDSPIGPSELAGTLGTFRVDQRVAVLLDMSQVLAGMS
jgi:purine-binding chemotaxis protein CheW